MGIWRPIGKGMGGSGLVRMELARGKVRYEQRQDDGGHVATFEGYFERYLGFKAGGGVLYRGIGHSSHNTLLLGGWYLRQLAHFS